MRMIRYIALIVILISACSKVQSVKDDPVFSLDTKAVSSLPNGSTYRIMMYEELDRSYIQSGTYYSKSGVEELVACRLDDYGAFQDEDASYGINGVSDKVNLVLASPGIKCNDDGSFDFVPDASDKFYVNAPKLMSVGGYGKIRFTEVLYDSRSKISFEFYKKSGLADFSLVDESVKVIGVNALNETVRIYPALRQVKMESNSHEREITLSPVSSPQAEDGYECFYYTSDASVLTIASGIYAPKEEAFSYLDIPLSNNVLDGDFIYMSCSINQNDRIIKIRMPLNAENIEMKPQYHYVYKVLVESDYVTVTLDIYDGSNTDWEAGGDSSSSIGALSSTIVIGEWRDGGWQSAGDIGFEIG